MTKSIPPKNLVVYADDDTDDLELVQDAFAQYSNNVDVKTFIDGGRTLSYLQTLAEQDVTPCLIILDVNMPVISGKEVLVRLREMDRFESVPVVLFTTSSLSADKSFASKYNAGFITKPIDVKQMEVITDEFINHCAEEIRDKIRKKTQ